MANLQSLLRRISVITQFALVGVILLVPLVYILAARFADQSAIETAASRELAGVAVIRDLMKPFLELHRDQLQEASQKFTAWHDRTLDRLATDQEYRDAMTAFEANVEPYYAMSKIHGVMQRAAETSGLIIDSQLEVTFLYFALVDSLPTILIKTKKITTLNHQIENTRGLDVELLSDHLVDRGTMDSALSKFKSAMNRCFAVSQEHECRTALEQPYKAFVSALAKFNRAADNQMAHSTGADQNADIIACERAVFDAADRLVAAGMNVTDDLISRQYARASIKIRTSLIIVLVFCILAVALASLVLTDIARPINEIDQALRRRADHNDLDIRLVWRGGNELGRLTNALNLLFENDRQWRINASLRTEQAVDARLAAERYSDAILSALNAHAIVSVTDATGVIIHVNLNFCAISEYNESELIGENHSLVNSGFHDREFFQSMWETIRRGETWRGEIRNKSKSGRHYWVDSTIHPVKNKFGSIDQFISIRYDITSRKVAESALVSKETLLEAVGHLSHVGGWSIDFITGEEFITAEAARLFFSRAATSSTLMTTWRRFLEDEAYAKFAAAYDSCRLRGASWEQDFPLVNESGDQRWIRSIGRANLLEGKVIGVIGAIQDITEQKQAEVTLRAALTAAQEAVRVKSRFLSNMSHEIRTPLNGILGMIGILRTEIATDVNQSILDNAELSGRHLLKIVNEILDISRLEANEMALESISFSPISTFDFVHSMLSSRAHSANLNFELHVMPDVPTALIGDEGRIRQVAINLVGNAIKFTESGTINLNISGEMQDKNFVLRVTVVDTGIGIDRQVQDRIFDEFKQADESTSRKFGGTGLGLAISRRLVHLMGGEIYVESELGRGAKFWFDVPCEIGTQAEFLNAQLATSVIKLRPLRVLVAEDNAINQIVIQHLLTRAGHYCDVVGNGDEVLQAVNLAPYDLILMDAQMPEMDGVEAVRHIRLIPAPLGTIPIIMVTADAMVGDRERFLTLGANEHVPKPIDYQTLMSAMARALPNAVLGVEEFAADPANYTRTTRDVPAKSEIKAPNPFGSIMGKFKAFD